MKNSYQLYPEVIINGNLRIIDEIYIAPLGHLMIKFYDEERKTYNKNFDRIFGKTQKNYNRQKG